MKLTKRFDELDTNGDGKLSREYVIKILKEETNFDDDSCEKLVYDADDENDGSIQKEEFLGLWSFATWSISTQNIC